MSTAEMTPPKASEKTFPLEADNIGPIKRASLVFPPCGVAMLRGKSGCGKSTLLRGIESAVSGIKPDISVRDRELHGELACFGISLKFGARMSRKGEPEVEGIQGLDIGEFIDPKLDNVVSADAKRIRCLVRLSGQSADPVLFYGLVDGGKEAFEALLPDVNTDNDDLLVLSKRVKSGLEREARKTESAADQERGRALACSESAKSVGDLTVEHDPQALQRAMEQALEQKTALEQQTLAGMRAKSKYDAAKARLTEAQAAQLEQATVEDCKVREAAALDAKGCAEKELEMARRALALAESRQKLALQEWTSAVSDRSSAESRQALIAGWEQALKDGEPVIPGEAELEAATTRATTARKAVEQGALIRKAIISEQEAEHHLILAQQCAKAADKLRSAAGSVDSVLSGVVSRMGGLVRVESDRLVTDTVRGKTYVSDLSDGERCRIGMKLFLDRLGTRDSNQTPKAVMTLAQGFWGELPPSVKVEIDSAAKEFGVLVLTAEATDDEELTAAVL